VEVLRWNSTGCVHRYFSHYFTWKGAEMVPMDMVAAIARVLCSALPALFLSAPTRLLAMTGPSPILWSPLLPLTVRVVLSPLSRSIFPTWHSDGRPCIGPEASVAARAASYSSQMSSYGLISKR
jgi:hypothetical protein